MKADRPSRTAHFVAHGRALADAGLSHVPDFRDPTARVFLSEKGKRSLSKTEHAAREGKRGMAFEMARVMADMIALRTAAIEPQISAWTPEEMAADLKSVGFLVREDSGMADWNDRFAQSKAKVERGSYMRIAIART